MAEEIVNAETDTNAEEVALRIYEIGYHILPTVKEEDLEHIVGGIRSVVEKAGGTFIAEGAPVLMRLSYGMEKRENDKISVYDRSYFGWIKFESPIVVVEALNSALKQSADVLRHIIFNTVREDTRAKMRTPQLREVKRTDTIKAAPRRSEESAAPISEADLEKALQDITTD